MRHTIVNDDRYQGLGAEYPKSLEVYSTCEEAETIARVFGANYPGCDYMFVVIEHEHADTCEGSIAAAAELARIEKEQEEFIGPRESFGGLFERISPELVRIAEGFYEKDDALCTRFSRTTGSVPVPRDLRIPLMKP